MNSLFSNVFILKAKSLHCGLSETQLNFFLSNSSNIESRMLNRKIQNSVIRLNDTLFSFTFNRKSYTFFFMNKLTSKHLNCLWISHKVSQLKKLVITFKKLAIRILNFRVCIFGLSLTKHQIYIHAFCSTFSFFFSNILNHL